MAGAKDSIRAASRAYSQRHMSKWSNKLRLFLVWNIVFLSIRCRFIYVLFRLYSFDVSSISYDYLMRDKPVTFRKLYNTFDTNLIELFLYADAMTSSQQSSGDYWDDDWDDDSEVGQTQAYVPPTQQIQMPQQNNADHGNLVSMHTIHSVIPERPIPNVPKKNNKFSTLIKSGEDSFLLGVKQVNVPESERLFIEEGEGGRCTWVPTGESYSCVVTSPKKESKLKGLKSFIVYQLTPTVNENVSSCLHCAIKRCLAFLSLARKIKYRA